MSTIYSPPANIGSGQQTCGEFQDEVASRAELDARLAKCSHLFTVYREVRGYYLQPRIDTLEEEKRPRIDYLLVPKPALVEAGWTAGAVGIEAKASGVKLGPVISQCLNYQRAQFEIKPSGVLVGVRWVFIWPLRAVYNDIESVMNQNRIGSLWGDQWALLRFKVGGTLAIAIDQNGKANAKTLVNGRKAGSR